jgi:regulator of protease activity HflC (stomatin/prohibitin superfamily)
MLKPKERSPAMRKTIRIRKHELGLWFRHGDLHKVLESGKHVIWSLPWSTANAVELVDTLRPQFEHERLVALVRDARLAERLSVVDLKDDERALVWIDGRLGAIVGSGVHAFWNASATIEVERYSVNTPRFAHERLEAILGFPGAAKHFTGVRVESHERVLVFRDGDLVDQLGPGHSVYWRGGPAVTWKSVDLREQVADIQGQEILTADKVTVRLNVVVTHRVVDPVKAVTEVADWAQTLYREAQLKLRAAVGVRSLEKLLADKDEVGNEISNLLATRAAEFGVSVSGAGLRDIILPGDMKTILNEVIVAQKQAEANLIRRREETAAARSQANTAKLLAENPVLARMKELEALQEILRGTSATFVLGSGDLAEQVSTLIRKETANM